MYYHKIGLSICCLAIISSSYTWALYGFGESITELKAFVSASSIDNTSVVLAQSAMSLLGQSVGSETLTNTNDSDDTPNSTITSPYVLLAYDIISAVQTSTNKTQTITDHLTQLNQSTSTLTQDINSYQARVDSASSELDQCIIDKSLADSIVVELINNDTIGNLDTQLQGSINAGQCIIKQQIIIKSLTLLTGRYRTLLAQIQKKSTLIQNNQQIIIQYPEIINDPSIITQLRNISAQF